MIALIIISALVLIAILCIIASEFSAIAQEKGFNSKRYFWYVLLFGLFGAIMVVALPDRNSEKLNQAKHINNSVSKTPTANEWKCRKCGKINQNYVGTCGCGEIKPR